MPEAPRTIDLCVIGGGTAGLAAAVGAAQMGAKVVLIEAAAPGGARLAWQLPCQALVAAGHAAQRLRRPGHGLTGTAPAIDLAAVVAQARRGLAPLAANDSAERCAGLGVTLLRGTGHFTGPDTVTVGDSAIRARRFLIATGAAPQPPDCPGLAALPCLTPETLFDVPDLPDHLLVLGGGPTAVELAQAFRRLGSAVTLIAAGPLLPDEDEELAGVLRLALRRDGVAVMEDASLLRAGGTVTLETSAGTVSGSHLLLAGERTPCLAGLGLEAAGITHTTAGITVDSGLRTSNRRVYACGGVLGGRGNGLAAAHQAGLVLRNALFRLPVRYCPDHMPQVVLGEPELARVGPGEAAARARHGRIQVLRWAMADIERAQLEATPEGLCKVLLDRRGRVVSAAIAGRNAGELIQPWSLAVGRRLPVAALAGPLAPALTLGEVSRRTAVSHLLPRLLSDRMKTVVGWLAKLG